MQFSLEIDIEPDEQGVYDGINLAAVLIRQAYLHLTPYAGRCPSCTDMLFQHVANFAIDHTQNEGPLHGDFKAVAGTRIEQIEAHFAGNVERVREMIGHDHHHGGSAAE